MTFNRRLALFAGLAAGVLAATPAIAADWRDAHKTLTLGVITSENEADRIERYKPVRAYMEKELGVEIKWRSATDYAGVIEGLKAGKIDIARVGPAAYAKAWMVMNGEVEPLVGELDNNGDFGYFSVVIVKRDSPFQKIEDLKGKRFAFADPNSTSGHQAPRYFLGESGIDADTFFGQTSFSGSHENSVMALMNDTFDAAATWYRTEERSNMTRMEGKGMIEPGQWRVIWKTPRLPSSPWAMSTDKPAAMRADIKAMLMNMKTQAPEAWQALTDGKASAYREVEHAEYEAIVRMIKANERQRRAG